MKITVITCALCAFLTSSLLDAAVRETYVNLKPGGSATPPTVMATTEQQWNEVTVSTGGASGPWPSGTTVSGIQMLDKNGNNSYELSVKKLNAAGIWSYTASQGNFNVPGLPYSSIPVPDSVTQELVGVNNGANIVYTLSGFEQGDVIRKLYVGGFVQNLKDGSTTSTKYDNVYTMTISGATLASVENLAMTNSSEAFTQQWTIVDDHTLTLTFTRTDKTLDSYQGFVADLTGLVMTGNDLSIQMGTTAAPNGGAMSGISYIAIVPEPTTCGLGFLSITLLCLRRRRCYPIA